MKNIGIITLFGYNNYGNRLQMYAVQKTYGDLGFTTEIIRYKQDVPKDPLVIQMKVLINKLFHLKSELYQLNLKRERISIFKKHAKKFYKESASYVNPIKINPSFHEKYAYLSVGSDQIWGWFTYPLADFVFVKFAPLHKRISFSPSFGSSTLDEKYAKKIKEGLEGFERISVREASGAQIVQAITDKGATVLSDPTMCISKSEWLQFSNAHKRKPQQKYILTYFLGELSPKVIDILKNLSAEFEIVNLNSFQSAKFYAVSPSEWVDYINDAELFLTDSFHGVVFSIVLQTPFAAYTRVGGESMETRIANILEKFKMEHRFEISSVDSLLFTMDFSQAEKIVNCEKLKVYDFLKKSLNIK